MKKVLIIGFGSIGKRHASAFKDLGANIALVTKQDIEGQNTYNTVTEALREFSADIVIIANDTGLHEQSLKELSSAGFEGLVMVEKPLGNNSFELKHSFACLVVSYNLRMSPILLMLKKELSNKSLVAANIYCGQYLPDWRPDRDYRNVYSAKKDLGGGVLRDLSHELDYAQWLLGPMTSVAAHGGHFSSLEIETDDAFTLIGESTSCRSVTVSVNYLDYTGRRTIIIHTNQESYYVDLIAGRLLRNSNVLLENIKTVDTYIEQARRLLNVELADFCSFEEGLHTMKLIEAAEKSVFEKRFISL